MHPWLVHGIYSHYASLLWPTLMVATSPAIPSSVGSSIGWPRCLKRILTGADSGSASSLFRASLCCCPAFTWEAAHRIYTAAFDSPSRLLPLSSSLFAAPSHSRSLPPALPLRPNRADGRGRGRRHHRPAPGRRRIPHGGSGSVRPTLPRRGPLPCHCGPRCCSQPNPNSVAFMALPLRRPPPPAPDRKSTRLNSSHHTTSRMPSSA